MVKKASMTEFGCQTCLDKGDKIGEHWTWEELRGDKLGARKH